MIRLISLLAVFTLAHSQEVNFPCPPTGRVTKITREPWQLEDEGGDGKLGGMTVECEDFPDPVEAQCAPANQSLVCDGKLEKVCPEGGYLGGLLGFVLEPETGATLLHPICCKTGAVQVDMEQCKSKRLNSFRSGFKWEARPDTVVTGIRCWQHHQHKEQGKKKLWDFIWKVEECPSTFDPNGGGGGDGGPCPPCSCTCDPFECPPGKTVHRLVTKRRKRQSCVCSCNCSYECV